MVHIRSARVEDARAILDLHVRARTTYYRGFLSDDLIAKENDRPTDGYVRAIEQRGVWCAELDDTIVGFVIIGPCHLPDPDPVVTRELYQIQVEPQRFRSGIGSALHATAANVWRSEHVAAVRLWAWEFNERARAFYTSRGWVADGHCRQDDPRIGEYRMLGYRFAVGSEDFGA